MLALLTRRPALLTALITVCAVLISWAVSLAVWHYNPDINVWLHFTLATVMPGVMAPATLYPVARMNFRLGQMRLELERQARTDLLTGLPNRRHFFERAAVAQDALEESGGSNALMMVDIDHFKLVNDTHGHNAGDAVIRAVACAIQDAVSATGPGSSMVARIGGEEFAVLVENIDEREVVVLAAHICDQVRATWTNCNGAALSRTVSIGIALWGPGESIDAALHRADQAIYEAKNGGRDRWCLSGTERLGDVRAAKQKSFPVARGAASKYPKASCAPASTQALSTR